MTAKCRRVVVSSLLVAGLAAVSASRTSAGEAAIGFVAGSPAAMISGEPVRGTTAVFSGDSITAKGPTVVRLKGGSQVTLDRDSVASFRRVTDEVNVTLDRANLSLYHPATGQGLKVQAGDISIEPAKGFKTNGEVAMANNQISVTAREGSMRLHGDGVSMEAHKG